MARLHVGSTGEGLLGLPKSSKNNASLFSRSETARDAADAGRGSAAAEDIGVGPMRTSGANFMRFLAGSLATGATRFSVRVISPGGVLSVLRPGRDVVSAPWRGPCAEASSVPLGENAFFPVMRLRTPREGA